MRGLFRDDFFAQQDRGAIMNKSLLTIVVGLAIAFFSAPARLRETAVKNMPRK
jgi:flagellar biosynthesis protein FliQ